MIAASDFIRLPYTHDLTEAGIAYALKSLSHMYTRMGGNPYDRLRRVVASTAVELAFRRHLSEQNIPFDIKSAAPFTDPNRYDVALGGRRCDIQSFFISRREQISEMKRNPRIILSAPALVPSERNAAEGHSDSDIYLFAFLSGLVAASREDLKKAIGAGQSHYLIHAMPDAWIRPAQWNPLGALVLKSEGEEAFALELNGQDEKRELHSLEAVIPSRGQIEIHNEFFSLTHFHAKTPLDSQISVHCSQRKESHFINASDWSNIQVYGMEILLVGFLTREEFVHKAKPVSEGTRVFQYDKTRTKNLAVSVSELKPLAELFARIKEMKQ